MEYKQNIEEEIYNIENCEEHNQKLRSELDLLEIKMKKKKKKKCVQICMNCAKKFGEILSQKINKELSDLEMPNAKIQPFL